MGKSDIYYYFFKLGLSIARENAMLSFITARYFLEAQFADNLRSFLLSVGAVDRILDFGNFTVFDGVGTKACISVIRRISDEHERHANEVKFFRLEEALNTNQVQDLLQARLDTHNMYSIVSQANLGLNNWNTTAWNNITLTRTIDYNCVSLGSICFIGKGMETGLNDIFVVNRAIIKRHNIPQEYLRKLIKNQDIRSYFVEFRDLFLIYPEEVIDLHTNHPLYNYLSSHKSTLISRAAYIRGNCEWYKFTWPLHKQRYYLPKIVVPYIAPENRFALDAKAEYVGLTDTAVIFPLEKTGVRLEYLLSLLNSSLLNFRYRLIAKPKDYRYEYFENSLSKIPIRRIAFSTPEDERARLAEKGRRLYEQFCQKDDFECVLGFVEHHLPNLPDRSPDTANERSDVTHDLLAFLAEQMIEFNKQRQSALDDLLLDLEGVLPPSALDSISRLWTPPKAGATPDDEAQRILGALATRRMDLRADIGALDEEQWKWLVRRRVKKLESLADMVRVFRRHHPPIAALDHRIAVTDRLIDRIVYRLYNLSSDEIAIVEHV